MSPTQRLGTGFRQPEMQHLALRDQVLDCTCNVFDGDLWIDAVLVYEVDPIGAPPLQHRLDGPANVLGATIQATHHATSIGIDVPTEFRRVNDFVADRGESFTEDSFDFKWAIRFCRVKKRNAMLMSGACKRDHVGAIWMGRVEGSGEVLTPETYA